MSVETLLKHFSWELKNAKTLIMGDLATAEEDSEVKTAILLCNSPGGTMSGLPETADRIRRFPKPIWAVVPPGGQLGSAMYYLAAACNGIIGSKSGDYGSIGVYGQHFDISERLKASGVKVKVFSSGPYKGMGLPGTSLTPEQEQFYQDRVLSMAQGFYDHLHACRPQISDEDMQGQYYNGVEALNRGFIDDIMGSMDEVKTFLS